MKIWIVSSDPFLRDFEKIANSLSNNNIVLISSISKYGFGIGGHFNFFKDYKNFKPDVILTDHGYPGFWIIKLVNKKIKLFVFLRGNYWLEKRLRGE